MGLVLNIDTATEIASVCVSENGKAISYRENTQQKEHAVFVHAGINAVMKETAKELPQIDAVGVTAGPGSYTGLRVGMATAKGFCYALKRPLITVSTLQVMLQAALSSNEFNDDGQLFCPMIDARRMEVFTAIYNNKKEVMLSPTAMLLDTSAFNEWLSNYSIVFFGSGSEKSKGILKHKNAVFVKFSSNAKNLGVLAEQLFIKKDFADIAYAEPNYTKDFYSTMK
jgi:tRNA threonylcarbamoyladenosine biosynthesis protein TsaB